MSDFLDPSSTSLKICGVTRMADAEALVNLGVHGIGINFWPQSKRYLSAEKAEPILRAIAGNIVRVGVFVNADPRMPSRLLEQGLIDIAQFHGDETAEYCAPFANAGHRFIKAIGVKNQDSLNNIAEYRASAVLLDTPAPGVYGGTGEKFDWTIAATFIQNHPNTPVLLAGGITPQNAAEAIAQAHPAALDVASGAEISPGIKDLDKVAALLASTQITPH
ncbi:N-(5'-phosphoribosyl)anthranilate isomerase [Oceaniferula spumae]|uniref:N-(5'-phosphoribosyl)anthranilate isomerase n=1 Tax=Oceaniferula spumae TaxID=2979115 RepID=A0AAT9FGU3_9BACT